MGRGDKGDAPGKAELDETVLTGEAGLDTETSGTGFPLGEIAPTKVPAEKATKLEKAANKPTEKAEKPGEKAEKPAEQADTPEKADTPGKAAEKPEPPRPEAPRPQAPPEEPAPVPGHRRGPGLWLPLIVFVVLLVAGAIAGGLIVPGGGPSPGAAPATAALPSLTQPVAVEPTPTELNLPTPPVREADQLTQWAQRIGGVVNVPPVAMQAYAYAQLAVLRDDPSCHLSWTTVAAIGEVESAHGQLGGAVLQSSGRSAPLIVGPVLDGKNGRILVKDTDAGAFDGDTTYDRAMGPLGLTPTEWRAYGIDADGDGILDPYDIDDASLALARALCSGTEDLSQRAGWNAAIARHHAGSAYAKSVFTSADSYGQRTKNMG